MSYNPRRLRVQCDDESVTLYQAFPTELSEAAVRFQSLLHAPGFNLKRMTWFKTSFTQMMFVSDYATRGAKRSRILVFKVTYAGLEDVLAQAALSYVCDVTTSGVKDPSAYVHVIWDAARTPLGNRSKSQKSMHIGVTGPVLQKLVEQDILVIEDVTWKAQTLIELVSARKRKDAENLIAQLGEEEIPIENEDIEWNLGML